MKVILLENVKRIGSIGEVIDVKRGFARNFLIANKKALYASKENIKEVEKIKTELSKKDNEKKKDASQVAEKINGKEYDENKFDDKTKNYVIARQELVQNQARLEIEMEKVQVLIRYYNAKICEFLGIDPNAPKEDTKETPKE